jgi:hypothetical protein
MTPWPARRAAIEQGASISQKLAPSAFVDVWLPRAKLLAELVDRPMTPGQVVGLRFDLAWGEDLIRNVLAYADGRTLGFVGGMWRRT